MTTHCRSCFLKFSIVLCRKCASRIFYTTQYMVWWCGTGAKRLFHTTKYIRRAPQARASERDGKRTERTMEKLLADCSLTSSKRSGRCLDRPERKTDTSSVLEEH